MKTRTNTTLALVGAALLGSTKAPSSLLAAEEEILIGWRGGTSTEYPSTTNDTSPALWIGTFRTQTTLQDGIEPVRLFSGAGGLPSAYWFDGFDVSSNTFDINLELGPPRQGGPIVPTGYVSNTGDPSTNYHDQLVGGLLQLAGDGAQVFTAVSPTNNFNYTGSGAVVDNFSFSIDVAANAPTGATFISAGITMGCLLYTSPSPRD